MEVTKDRNSFRPFRTASVAFTNDEQLIQTGAMRLLDKKQKMFELQEALEKEKAALLSKV